MLLEKNKNNRKHKISVTINVLEKDRTDMRANNRNGNIDTLL